MSVEIAWKQNILVTDFHLLKSLLVVLGFGSQAFLCGFSRQNINSVLGACHVAQEMPLYKASMSKEFFKIRSIDILIQKWCKYPFLDSKVHL